MDVADAVRRAVAGEGSGHKDLFTRFYPRVVAACHGYGALDSVEAEDAAQDAFVRAFRALPSLREPQHFGRWVLAIAHNRCRTLAARGGRRAVAMRAYVEQVKLEASMPSKREQELLDVMLTQVTDDKVRRVAEMYYVEGYTSGEISRVIGIPVSTVTTWMSRLMAKVRAKLIADGLDTVR